MKKLLIVLLLIVLAAPTAFAVTTDENFDYAAITKYAQGYYGTLYTLVGRVLQVEELHRSSAADIVEEYTTIAVDDDPEQVVCLHYTRSKQLSQMSADVHVAVLAYVDGVQRIGSTIIPLMESNSAPVIFEEN